MSTIRSRWAGKLAIRKKLLATARAKAAFWRRKKNQAKEPSRAYSHAGAMLHARDELAAKRKAEVEFAERILRRHAGQSLRAKALNEARAALARHIFESGGNNRGPQVEQIIRYAGGDVGEPWCVDFVIWCYGHAGSTVVKTGFPRAVSMMNQSGVHITTDPRPGDIVRFAFDHTGVFVKDNGNGTITTIEGNTGAAGAVSDGNGSDGVYEKVRAKTVVADYLHVEA